MFTQFYDSNPARQQVAGSTIVMSTSNCASAWILQAKIIAPKSHLKRQQWGIGGGFSVGKKICNDWLIFLAQLLELVTRTMMMTMTTETQQRIIPNDLLKPDVDSDWC